MPMNGRTARHEAVALAKRIWKDYKVQKWSPHGFEQHYRAYSKADIQKTCVDANSWKELIDKLQAKFRDELAKDVQ